MRTPVLLLHGAIGSKDQLDPLKNLLKRIFSPHTLNFPGHGGELFRDEFSIPSFAGVVLKYLDANKLGSVNIFGYSMGGYVGMYLARHYPDRVSRVVTLGTKYYWDKEVAKNECRKLVAEKIEEKVPAFAEILKKRHFPNDWKLLLERTRSMMEGLGEKNALTEADFKQIKQRCIIAIGENDEMVTREETANVAGWLPDARLLVLPGTPHAIEKAPFANLAEQAEMFFEQR